jgi:hypothetical protein
MAKPPKFERDNLKAIYNYLRYTHDLSEMDTRAIVGNLLQESLGDPSAENGNAYGIAQWLGSRKKELMKKENPESLMTQLDFMMEELKGPEKKAWNKLQEADTLEAKTKAFRTHYERPGEDEARDDKRVRYADFDSTTFELPQTSDLQSPRKVDFDPIEIRDRVSKKYQENIDALEGRIKEISADENLTDQEKQGQLKSIMQSLETMTNERQGEIDREIQNAATEFTKKYNKETKEIQETQNKNAGTPTAEQAIQAESNKADQWDQMIKKTFEDAGLPVPSKPDFNYNKGDYKNPLNIPALAQGAMGLIGLSQAQEEMPEQEFKISPADQLFLEESKRISESGIPVAEEAKLKNDLKESFKIGVDNLTRASGGDRNAVLANTGALSAAQAKAITELQIADQMQKNKGFELYSNVLDRIETRRQQVADKNFNLSVAERNRRVGNAENLANNAFSTMMDEIAYQRNNGPGSANHMMREFMNVQMFGQSNAEDKGQPYSKSWREAQDAKMIANYNAENAKYNQSQFRKELLDQITPGQKAFLQDQGFNAETFNWDGISNVNQIIERSGGRKIQNRVQPVSQAGFDMVLPAVDMDYSQIMEEAKKLRNI